jgi:addiction module HigA family antidote
MADLLRVAGKRSRTFECRDRGLSLEKELTVARPAIHPGEILAEELAELGISPTELSRQIAVPPNRVTQIIKGQRSITGDTALRLGHWFKTSAQFWLNLQAAYDIRVAKQQAGVEIDRLPTRPAQPQDVHRKQSSLP